MKLKPFKGRLEKAYNRYDDMVMELQKKLTPYVDFEFHVQYVAGDGAALLNTETGCNMDLGIVLEHIDNGGRIDEAFAKKYSFG